MSLKLTFNIFFVPDQATILARFPEFASVSGVPNRFRVTGHAFECAVGALAGQAGEIGCVMQEPITVELCAK
jgi:hypothetical protein